MFGKKIDLIIGLTTFHNELMRISVPALSRLRGRFLLIIYNDNPTTNVTRRDIRRLGYRGRLHIINGTENVDTMRARMEIVRVASKLHHVPKWIIFINDNDILVNADIPDVGLDVFAVMQNSISLRRRVADLVSAIANPDACVPDGENAVLVRPNIGICGIPLRFSVMRGLNDTVAQIYDKMHEIDDSLDFRPPFDAIMWTMLNTYARHINPTASPIYMDTVNYITTNLDTSPIKYGRAILRGAAGHARINDTIARYDAILAAALNPGADK
ncbi:MAG: hypothetical protein NC311_01800 [Muribaculaceae bacterium]|nr:hypothetical protein [Muribaculaceae bacterium]